MSLRRWLYLMLAFAVFAPLASPQQICPYLDTKLSPRSAPTTWSAA